MLQYLPGELLCCCCCALSAGESLARWNAPGARYLTSCEASLKCKYTNTLVPTAVSVRTAPSFKGSSYFIWRSTCATKNGRGTTCSQYIYRSQYIRASLVWAQKYPRAAPQRLSYAARTHVPPFKWLSNVRVAPDIVILLSYIISSAPTCCSWVRSLYPRVKCHLTSNP